MSDAQMAKVQALIKDCPACKRATYQCPQHGPMLDRLCWEAWPNVRYGGKSNAERLAAKPADYGKVPDDA